jgi:GNAT superfamily N-acetyltransferase
MPAEEERVSQIVDVPILSRNTLIPLFESHIRDRASIDCVLEGHFGTARADSLGAPTVARLDCGPFAAFAGDAAASAAASAVADLIGCAPVDWVTPETSAWRSALERAFPSRIRAIPSVTFSSAALDTDALDRLAHSLPSGYMLLRLDAELAGRLIAQMKKGWLLDSYASLDDFLRRGIGYVVTYGDEIVASASSAIRSSSAIDIDIETAAAHRRKGLGTAVGAALALECLVRGIDPLWLASNETSCRLATKLGYTRGDLYETFEIAPKSEG